MVKVFIGYGGKEAEFVAGKLEKYLRSETDMETFLVAPSSRTLPANVHDYSSKIIQELQDCNILVFICHTDTSKSKPMMDEVDFIFENGLKHKLILFSASNECIPPNIRAEVYHPLHFPPEKAEESFCRFTNEIYRCYIANLDTASVMPEPAEVTPK